MRVGADAAVTAVAPVKYVGDASGQSSQVALVALVALLAVVAVLALMAVAVHALFDPRSAGVARVRCRRMYGMVGTVRCACAVAPAGVAFPQQGKRTWERVVERQPAARVRRGKRLSSGGKGLFVLVVVV